MKVWETGAAIYIAGVLASAAGIGGGGIFVAILMFISDFTPHIAVPMSKAIIFGGSLMSFYMNQKRRDANGDRMIDFELVKNIVPMALAGTLFGVLFNVRFPAWLIVICLSTLLFFMTVRTLQAGISKYNEEVNAINKPPADTAPPPASVPERLEVAFQPDPHGYQLMNQETRTSETIRDVILMVCMLLIVILCGTARHKTDHSDVATRDMLILIPSTLCILLTVLFRSPWWNPSPNKPTIGYPIVAFSAGICSGLFGIGGGLIFSPFLLHQKVDATKATVTSATCVIFTASSTTFQYLLMGRIMIDYALIYGAMSTLASIAGAKLVSYINKRYGRASFIIFLVGIAVGISCILSVIKGVRIMHEVGKPVSARAWSNFTCLSGLCEDHAPFFPNVSVDPY